MAKVIKPARLGKALNEALEKHKNLTEKQINKAIKITAIKVWGDIIKLTPVDEGRARGSWFVGLSPTSKLGDTRDKNKGSSYVAKELPKDVLHNKVYLYNNTPYIEKLEYGGYGKTETEKTNAQGYSKLAPRGMVRVSLLKWGSTLKKVFKAI